MKTVMITGANKGIGFATAKLFLHNGYHVILAGRNEQKLIAARERLDNAVHYVVWDVSDIHHAPIALEQAHRFYGNIDTIINNAGTVSEEDITGRDFFEKTEQAWDDTMNTNLKGLFFAIQAEAKYMIQNSISGHIVNVCSEMSYRAAYNAYTISKWGALGMTKGLGRRLAKENIILNGVAPGETATEIFRVQEGLPVKIDSPRGERAMPAEIAEAIYFLANSKNIIGQVIITDGGRSLH